MLATNSHACARMDARAGTRTDAADEQARDGAQTRSVQDAGQPRCRSSAPTLHKDVQAAT